MLSLCILIPVMAISLLTNQEIFNAYLVWGDQHFNLQFMQLHDAVELADHARRDPQLLDAGRGRRCSGNGGASSGASPTRSAR